LNNWPRNDEITLASFSFSIELSVCLFSLFVFSFDDAKVSIEHVEIFSSFGTMEISSVAAQCTV
jgi:hypothetical protein